MNFHPAPTEWGKGSMFGYPLVHAHGLSPILSERPSNIVPPRYGAGYLSAAVCPGWLNSKTQMPSHFTSFPFILEFSGDENNSFMRHRDDLKRHTKQSFLPVAESESLEEKRRKTQKGGEENNCWRNRSIDYKQEKKRVAKTTTPAGTSQVEDIYRNIFLQLQKKASLKDSVKQS